MNTTITTKLSSIVDMPDASSVSGNDYILITLKVDSKYLSRKATVSQLKSTLNAMNSTYSTIVGANFQANCERQATTNEHSLSVHVTLELTSGVKIAEISVDDDVVELFAPKSSCMTKTQILNVVYPISSIYTSTSECLPDIWPDDFKTKWISISKTDKISNNMILNTWQRMY